MDRESGTKHMLRKGELFTAGGLAMRITDIQNNQATFEASGSAVELALGN
jgi:hypothetical protein